MSQDNTALSINFTEDLYLKYLKDPTSIEASWRKYFAQCEVAQENSLYDTREIATEPFSLCNHNELTTANKLDLNAATLQLINAYRKFGHTQVNLDPLGMTTLDYLPELDYKIYGITENDLATRVNTFGAFNIESMPLKKLLSFLQQTYANRIGLEYEHIESLHERTWLQAKLEQNIGNIGVSQEKKIEILYDLLTVESFEHFIHLKFPGAKRFSIEGGESTIPALQEILKSSAKYDMEELVIGMAHRGRLSVLSRILTKPYPVIFAEFMGASSLPSSIPGDVKYHLGASYCQQIEGKNVYITLVPNPSHLESVNSVALGRCKAKQEILKDTKRAKVLPILIHGDASVSGQGCVMESLSLSQLKAYQVGGAIHIIINNQIGFTTNNDDSYSSRYCSNIAKFIDAPILHVNGNDPEAVVFAANIATEYRYKFHKDIFIDIVCYRKYGHNEGDEPLFTQPLMYKIIQADNHLSPVELYRDKLITEGRISLPDYEKMKEEFIQKLEEALSQASAYKAPQSLEEVRAKITLSCSGKLWQNYFALNPSITKFTTGVSLTKLIELGNRLCLVPAGFQLNNKIGRQLEQKTKMISSGEGLDWSMGEALAYASLLDEGYDIRFTGEDVERGTFSHRHAVLVDQENEEKYIPLNNLYPGQKSNLFIHNSNLSEFAVLGFEYGYSTAKPDSLTIWEGQFGDFANGAQIIIDQYLASSEAKWLYMSGLVLLLPHGYEGQGPEHSSARIERFLQLCALDNMRICNCTTPASFFHLIRSQMHVKPCKPLIIFTPKSLLRHKLAVSKLADLAEGSNFIPVIDDSNIIKQEQVKRLILCSGKVYYDLLEYRNSLASQESNTVALIRLEQLYPFPKEDIMTILKKYENTEIIWCQEEHKNMGAYSFIKLLMDELLSSLNYNKVLKYVGRDASASPATGFAKVHAREQTKLLQEAFAF